MKHDQESCRRLLSLLSDYIDEELPPMDCEELEKHLADCPPCVAFINTLRRTSSLFSEHCVQEKAPPEIAARLRERLQAIYRSPK